MAHTHELEVNQRRRVIGRRCGSAPRDVSVPRGFSGTPFTVCVTSHHDVEVVVS